MLYNGLDVHQTAGYIKLSAVTYVTRFLATHGWDTDAKTIPYDIAPIPSSTTDQLQKTLGPKEGTKEHQQLQDEVGFSYRQVLGELMYSYTLVRCDIGYAVTFLARLSLIHI